jgi:hypothetical protein
VPGDSGVTCMLVCASTTTLAHETAGASGARHSPRPLLERAGNFWQTSGAARREIAKVCLAFEYGNFRRVGKAKRAHRFASTLQLVGTAQARLCPPYKLSSSGLTGRSSIPETPVMEPMGRGVLDPRLREDDDRRACMRADPMARNDVEGAVTPPARQLGQPI